MQSLSQIPTRSHTHSNPEKMEWTVCKEALGIILAKHKGIIGISSSSAVCIYLATWCNGSYSQSIESFIIRCCTAGDSYDSDLSERFHKGLSMPSRNLDLNICRCVGCICKKRPHLNVTTRVRLCGILIFNFSKLIFHRFKFRPVV